MMSFLEHRSRRFGYCGWALKMPGASNPLEWTVSTTREEVRELRKLRADLFERGAEIVKVRISVSTYHEGLSDLEAFIEDCKGVSFSSARAGEVSE